MYEYIYLIDICPESKSLVLDKTLIQFFFVAQNFGDLNSTKLFASHVIKAYAFWMEGITSKIHKLKI